MIEGIAAAAVLLLLSAACGSFIQEKQNTARDDLTAPFGAAVIFALLEVLYLPALILNLSMTWIMGTTLFAGVVLLYLVFRQRHDLLRQCRDPYAWITILSGIVFTVIFVRCGGNAAAIPDAYLEAMLRNIRAPALALGDFHMQGYAPFASLLMGYARDPVHVLLALGLFANMIGAGVTLNILKSFRLRNPWLRFVLVTASIFYMNFYSWKIIASYSADNWRILFTAINIHTAYLWIKNGNENVKYEMLAVTMAGLFVSNGFSLLAIELLYALFVFFLERQRVRTLYDIITLCSPVILYGCAWMGKWAPVRAWTIVILYVALLLWRNTKGGYRFLVGLENFLIDHCRKIFLIIVPAVFLIGSLILRIAYPHFAVPFSEYIGFLKRTTIRPYIIVNSSLPDIIVDVFRYGGLAWMLFRAKKEEDRMVRILFMCTVTFFINPLCMGLFTRITGPEVYANAFEILFNPFTDILIFVTIYYLFEWNVIGQWVLELSLCAAVLLGHVGSYCGQPYGLYTNLLQEGVPITEVNP